MMSEALTANLNLSPSGYSFSSVEGFKAHYLRYADPEYLTLSVAAWSAGFGRRRWLLARPPLLGSRRVRGAAA